MNERPLLVLAESVERYMAMAVREANAAGLNADRIRDSALMSGAIPGEFEVVLRFRGRPTRLVAELR